MVVKAYNAIVARSAVACFREALDLTRVAVPVSVEAGLSEDESLVGRVLCLSLVAIWVRQLASLADYLLLELVKGEGTKFGVFRY